jgi:hypothetical protein
MDGAVCEAESGNAKIAKAAALDARALTASRDTQILAALTLARTGNTSEAENLALNLEKRYPPDTLVTDYWIPVIRASIDLKGNNAAHAVKGLQPTAPYELASPVTWSGLGGPCIRRICEAPLTSLSIRGRMPPRSTGEFWNTEVSCFNCLQ